MKRTICNVSDSGYVSLIGPAIVECKKGHNFSINQAKQYLVCDIFVLIIHL